MSKRAQILNLWDMLAIDDTIFSDIKLDDRLDKDNLIAKILWVSGRHLPVETNTEIFKYFTNNWFFIKSKIISKLLDTLEFEYNPIDNFARNETITRGLNKDISVNSNETGNITVNETDTTDENGNINKNINNKHTTDSTFNAGTTAETTVSAFDVNTYSPREKVNNSGSNTDNIDYVEDDESTETRNNNINRNKNNINNNSKAIDSNTSDNENETTTIIAKGNIGVATTQDLIQQERVVNIFDIYEWIAIEFDTEFFVGVY